MRNFDQFGIPVFGLKPGLRRFEFEVDDDFFKSFESNPIQSGNYKIIIDFDKRDNEFLLQFDIKGTFESPCDRCLADIRVPSEINKLIWVLGVVGAPIGIGFGYLLTSYYSTRGINLVIFSKEGMEQFGMTNFIYPSVNPGDYLFLAMSVFITALLASLYPAYKAIKLNPVEAIRKM